MVKNYCKVAKVVKVLLVIINSRWIWGNGSSIWIEINGSSITIGK